MNAFLTDHWNQLASRYTSDSSLIDNLLQELLKHYSSKKRYYHNLNHIEALLRCAEEFGDKLEQLDEIYFGIWYHDAIYNVIKNNNEEKSAELARSRLTELGVAESKILTCTEFILSTKTHELNDGSINPFDAKFFLDNDLAILGASQEQYLTYSLQIKREYNIFPEFLYIKGRKKALESILQKERIFMTEYFFNTYEEKARANLKMEIEILSK